MSWAFTTTRRQSSGMPRPAISASAVRQGSRSWAAWARPSGAYQRVFAPNACRKGSKPAGVVRSTSARIGVVPSAAPKEPALGEPALREDDHPVAMSKALRAVGDHDDGWPRIERSELSQHGCFACDIDGVRRLVED